MIPQSDKQKRDSSEPLLAINYEKLVVASGVYAILHKHDRANKMPVHLIVSTRFDNIIPQLLALFLFPTIHPLIDGNDKLFFLTLTDKV